MNRRRRVFGLGLVVLLACGGGASPAFSQQSAPPSASLEKLVAPIALYPDPLVAQILPASTYPVEVVEAARDLQSGRPSAATASQWDPSIQALLSFPTVLKMMSDKINWTTQLGQAVAANQSEVMNAIQAVRRQAQAAGNLTSNNKQVVSVQGSGDTSTIIIEPASPQYIYVPQYNPVAILSPPPPYYYGATYGLLTFGAGFAAGAATAYACNWGAYGGYGSVTVNNSYHYNANNVYHSYNSRNGASGVYNPATGNSARYNPKTGTYTGYDAKTGTYGAYNPETGKYGTYDPSTGQYNKNGQTGTYEPGSKSNYPATGDSAHYNSKTGTYTGYDAKTGKYGAYNPETGKYGTYDPSTGQYNKNGQTGTYKPGSKSSNYSSWQPRSASDVGRSADDYHANQYGPSHYSGGDPAAGGQYGHGAASTGGNTLGSSGSGNRLGGSSGGGFGDRGFGGGYGGGRGFGGDSGFGDRGGGFGGDGFRGMGGGGWDARAASNRGFSSFGGRGFGGGGFRGGGFRR